MNRNKLFWHIYPTYLIIIALLTVSIMWFASDFLRRVFLDHSRGLLVDRGLMISEMLSETPLTEKSVDPLCKAIGLHSNVMVTILLPNGVIIGDSKDGTGERNLMPDHPEMASALKGNMESILHAATFTGQKILHMLIPYKRNGHVEAVIRVSSYIPSVDAEVRTIQYAIIVFGIGAAFFALLPAVFIYFRMKNPVMDLVKGIRHYAEGDLTYRIPVSESDFLSSLAKSLNHMAVQMDTRIRTVIYRKDKLETVLSNMLEGVLAVDNDEKALIYNQAVIDMFDIRTSYIIGRSVQELIRHVGFLKFVSQAKTSLKMLEGTLFVYQTDERILQVHSSPLQDARNTRIGTLFVFNDMTKVKQLENMRSEFVANVSHEIRTPLTAIRGFVETLIETDASEYGEETKRFLTIIKKHVDRLETIIRDLLNLSRIEKGNESESIRFEKTDVRKVVESAVSSCIARIGDNKTDIRIEGGGHIYGKVNASLLEQALLNLLDNAVKYSSNNGKVTVSIISEDSGIKISVKDNGIGIPKKHQSRVFERFYRVDKSRSRKLGGTGLGLAIVKHIIQAHNGNIALESYPNIGTTFTITLPMAPMESEDEAESMLAYENV